MRVLGRGENDTEKNVEGMTRGRECFSDGAAGVLG